MTLTDLRKRVIFQNSIDVWIESCLEVGADWSSVPDYMRFISYLKDCSLNLKAFTLCAHEAGATEKAKTDFAEALKATGDPNAATYTIKLNDGALDLIRGFRR
jgi:hypothetical protein